MRRAWAPLAAAAVLVVAVSPTVAVSAGRAAQLPVTAAPLQTWRMPVELVLPEPESEVVEEQVEEPTEPSGTPAPEGATGGVAPGPDADPGGASPAPAAPRSPRPTTPPAAPAPTPVPEPSSPEPPAPTVSSGSTGDDAAPQTLP